MWKTHTGTNRSNSDTILTFLLTFILVEQDERHVQTALFCVQPGISGYTVCPLFVKFSKCLFLEILFEHVVSFLKKRMLIVKAILYLGESANLFAKFIHLLSDFDEIRYLIAPHNVVERF